MRIFAISDLHTDFEANWREIQESSQTYYRDDLLIVAGDISHRMDVIVKTLNYLNSIFKVVCYTPGNHELWSKQQSRTSISKLNEILQFCELSGIQTKPFRFYDVWIVPLFSWYETKNLEEFILKDEMLLLWSDLYFCVWDEIDGCVSDFMTYLNKEAILKVSGEKVITFSHFLPTAKLLPDINKLQFKSLQYVSVCPQLISQIQALNSKTHIFGHTHINCDTVIDNVRYIQNAFGYPRENRFRKRDIFKLVCD
jgi:predicted phosphohydrolase